MMKQRVLIILIFALVLLSIASVGASDADDINVTSSAGMSDGIVGSDVDNINVQTVNDKLDDAISADEKDNEIRLDVIDENTGNGNSFNDLQSLIDKAKDKLDLECSYLRDEYYYKDIEISKDITIDGHGYTIDGNGGLIINIASNKISVTLMNITFSNGVADGGGAIQNAHEDSSLTIINCEFLENSAEEIYLDYGGSGGAIYSKGKLTITDSYFCKNNGNSSGGAICCLNNLLINNTVFRENTAGKGCQGGAIFCSNKEGKISIIDSVFEENEAPGNDIFSNYGEGGAIYCEFSNLYINNTSFTNNNAGC